MRILVVEDDRGTAGFIKKGFSEQGFAVDTAQRFIVNYTKPLLSLRIGLLPPAAPL